MTLFSLKLAWELEVHPDCPEKDQQLLTNAIARYCEQQEAHIAEALKPLEQKGIKLVMGGDDEGEEWKES